MLGAGKLLLALGTNTCARDTDVSDGDLKVSCKSDRRANQVCGAEKRLLRDVIEASRVSKGSPVKNGKCTGGRA